VFYVRALRRPEADDYRLRTIAKDRQNFFSGFGAGQALAHGTIVQKFCDRGERTQVRLKLIFWDDEKNDELDRRIVERIKLNACRRSSERGHDLLKPI
jgi:hypothetical protein